VYTIYEDDYGQTAFPRWDSDGAVELFWDHPDFPAQWSGRWCDSYPYDNWSNVTPLSPTNDSYGAWSLRNIILAHFGLYQRGVRTPWRELLTFTPDILQDLRDQDRAGEFYRHPDLERVCRILVPDFQQVNLELMEYLADHPDGLQALDWRQFERVLGSIFRNQGFQSELGPGSGDGGIDLRLISKDAVGPIITLVQAKKWHPSRPIPLEIVAALYGVVEAENANRGLIATTSRFLPSAQEFAEARGTRLVLAGPEIIANWCRAVVGRMNE
jgi:restriction endonuclease Mrr